MTHRTWKIVALLGLVAWAGPSDAAPSAAELVERLQQAFYYPGTDMKVRVTMDLVTAGGQKRTRVLTMLRRNGAGKQQRYFMYFHEPGDVRRTAFLVVKYPERDDDRWIFIPALNMVRRIAASDSRSSFVGSDFTYEDVSGRDPSADVHSILREEKLGDADCWVLESKPKTATDYTRKLSWIDQTSFLPRKEEYYDAQDQLARVFTADQTDAVSEGGSATKRSHPTVIRRTMTNVKSGHRTEVRFESVAYDLGLGDDVFSERSLQSPPSKWIAR